MFIYFFILCVTSYTYVYNIYVFILLFLLYFIYNNILCAMPSRENTFLCVCLCVYKIYVFHNISKKKTKKENICENKLWKLMFVCQKTYICSHFLLFIYDPFTYTSRLIYIICNIYDYLYIVTFQHFPFPHFFLYSPYIYILLTLCFVYIKQWLLWYIWRRSYVWAKLRRNVQWLQQQ